MLSEEDKILIEILRKEKRNGIKRLLAEFSTNICHSATDL